MPPVPLFEARLLNGPTNAAGSRHQYDVARDGRFLMNVPLEDAVASPNYRRPQLASRARSARKAMKIGARLNRMAPARSGEVDRPVAQSRPFNWLIRSVRLSE